MKKICSLILLFAAFSCFADVWQEAIGILGDRDGIYEAVEFGETSPSQRSFDRLYQTVRLLERSDTITRPNPEQLAKFIELWKMHLLNIQPYEKEYRDSFRESFRIYEFIRDFPGVEVAQFELLLAGQCQRFVLSQTGINRARWWERVHKFAARAYSYLARKNKDHQLSGEMGRALFLRDISEPERILKPPVAHLMTAMALQEDGAMQALLDRRYHYAKETLSELAETVGLFLDQLPPRDVLLYSKYVDKVWLLYECLKPYPYMPIKEEFARAAMNFFVMAVVRGREFAEIPAYVRSVTTHMDWTVATLRQIDWLVVRLHSNAAQTAFQNLERTVALIPYHLDRERVESVVTKSWPSVWSGKHCHGTRHDLIEATWSKNSN